MPDPNQIVDTLKFRLASYIKNKIDWKKLSEVAEGLNYAEISRACEEALKSMIINEFKSLNVENIMQALSERKSIVENNI